MTKRKLSTARPFKTKVCPQSTPQGTHRFDVTKATRCAVWGRRCDYVTRWRHALCAATFADRLFERQVQSVPVFVAVVCTQTSRARGKRVHRATVALVTPFVRDRWVVGLSFNEDSASGEIPTADSVVGTNQLRYTLPPTTPQRMT